MKPLAARGEQIRRPLHREIREYATRLGIRDLIFLNVGEPDFPTPPPVVEAGKAAMDEGFTHYTEERGIKPLREAPLKRTVGVDLAGVESRPTGICLLKASLEASFFTAYKTSQILEAVERFKPEIVGVDAPLNLPGEGNLRPCDRMLIHRGIRVLPPTLGGMRKLTLRAIELKEKLEGRGFKTLECFPGAVRILLKLPGKNRPKL